MFVQYHSDRTFSVFNVDEVKNTREALIENASVMVNPENNDELIIATDSQ